MQIQNINLPNHISLTSAPQKDITNLVLNYDHQRLTIKEGVSYTLIPISQIIFISADSNYSTLYLVNGKKIMTSKTLKVWEDKINHPFFIRCHRSYLVNVKYIDHIYKKNNSIDIMNHIIPMSRDRKKAIVHWIK
jgi:two-component system LytT family response regulator